MDYRIIEKEVRGLLETVCDPEIPVLSVIDLGIIRKIETETDSVVVALTPTYSGCPALEAIILDVYNTLRKAGYGNVQVRTELSPAWTTDWISEKGKDKLKAFGIAPPLPGQPVCHTRAFHEEEAIPCPRCNSYDTRLISRFGSTPCKALYQCRTCQEPFDYFKCH
ncbi:MAG: phenylacetate-CoA oxygenase subunit PaaJ [Puia sp.]|nr:phenylacetate-CoA oxygenase subunit PaaJ [Puia sp.]